MALPVESPAERLAAPVPGPLVPEPYRVAASRSETEDTVTLSLEPLGDPLLAPRPGQFNMLTVFGVGEVAISVSGGPEADGTMQHTVHAVGPVSRALCNSPLGSVVGVRGPFGTDWGVDGLTDRDVMVVAGGIGLAPLRMAVIQLAAERASGGGRRFDLLVGARTPDQLVFADEIRRWREQGTRVEVTVDAAGPGWDGPVGVVTTLLDKVPIDPTSTVALVCGPEVMIRFTARGLVDLGLPPENIRVSLERNMQCGVGLCGHCQLGPLLICRDGPVFDYAGVVADLLSQRER
jgi:NAD(P)H-flavin reductase